MKNTVRLGNRIRQLRKPMEFVDGFLVRNILSEDSETLTVINVTNDYEARKIVSRIPESVIVVKHKKESPEKT